MVSFDNTVFCLALHPDAKPPAGVDRAKDRIEFLLEVLKESGDKIIISTPALAEFLVFAGNDGPLYMAAIRDNAIFRVLPFDEKAAIENAEVELAARAAGEKRGSDVGAEWQKVKVDRQIIAVAKVNGATCLYSDDPHMAKLGRDFAIAVQGIADLPVPSAVQEYLDLAPHDENQSVPVTIRGSNNGPAEDQAGRQEEHEGEGGKATSQSSAPQLPWA